MNDFNCSCVPGYTGKNCSIGKPIRHVIESCYLQQLIADLITTYTWAFQNHFHDLLLSIMETADDYVEVPSLLQKTAKSAATT